MSDYLTDLADQLFEISVRITNEANRKDVPAEKCQQMINDTLWINRAAFQLRKLAEEEQVLPDPAEFERRMKEIENGGRYDVPDAHGDADELMCETLEKLGYGAGVEIFNSLTKWYE